LLGRTIEIFLSFLKLGLTSFGGPVAHISFSRDEFVERRKWLTEQSYLDLVALCQFLPGPASSQVGFAVGMLRGGIIGGIAAFLAFTLPSAIALVLFANNIDTITNLFGSGMVHGLKLVATAVVAQAIIGMTKSLCTTKQTAALAIAALIIATAIGGVFGQISAILVGGVIGLLLFKPDATEIVLNAQNSKMSLVASNSAIALFILLILGLPLAVTYLPSLQLELANSFYRSGALVFGGGHVVLPLLETEMVSTSLVAKDTFLAGYGATQAVPGPIFSFAAFLGATTNQGFSGALNAAVATMAIFLPGFLLVIAIMPHWQRLRAQAWAQGALAGANAAVVGILAAAFYSPVVTNSIFSAYDFTGAATAFILLDRFRIPPWAVVLSGAVLGTLLFS